MSGRPRLPARRICGLVAAILIAVVSGGCKRDDVRTFQGYTEGEYIKLTAPSAGNLSTLAVKRGARVTEGEKLFSLAEADEVAAHREAARRLEQTVKRREGRGQEAGTDSRELANLKAQVAEAEWKLAQKSANAPVDGVVTETLYAEGDWVPAGAPVVAILPVDKIKVRFAVPLSVALHLQNGRNVMLTCVRCEKPVEATVTHVSPFARLEPEDDSVEALRYMVEARPKLEQGALLKPGQPVTIHL